MKFICVAAYGSVVDVARDGREHYVSYSYWQPEGYTYDKPLRIVEIDTRRKKGDTMEAEIVYYTLPCEMVNKYGRVFKKLRLLCPKAFDENIMQWVWITPPDVLAQRYIDNCLTPIER